ncbi:DUF2336 domain-containing protein [Phreatobacter sp.]|uniref:DUF2336 domain-containing protein n=1 Tax=Phreatobacter sp. TaxID=1966341 RepID=UPI003F703339
MLPSLENPVEQVLAAVDQMSPLAQQALVTSILQQFGPERPRPTARAQDRLDRIVAHLLPPMPIARRVHYARAFGALDLDLPRTFAVIDRDEELVAEIGLGHGEADPDTIRALGKHRRYIDMRLMAARDGLSPEAAETLAETGDARTVRTLAGNTGAPLTSRARDRLVTRAVRDQVLQASLCARADLEDTDICRLATMIPDSLKAVLFEHHDAEVVARAQEQASAAIQAKVRRMRLEKDGGVDTSALAAEIRSGSRSLSEALLLLAATDRILPAVEMAAHALDLDRDLTLRALGRGKIEPFEAISRALGLDPQVHHTIVEALHRRWRKTAPDRRSSLPRYARLTEAMIDAELAGLRRREQGPPLVSAIPSPSLPAAV